MSIFSSAADYYPAGAYNDPSAPYNEVSIPERDFDLNVCQTLEKYVTVTTDDYIPEYDDWDRSVHYDTSETNWLEVYHENDYHTPLQLIELFKQCLEENLKNGVVFKSPKYTENLIKECEGWEAVETDIE